MRKKEMERLERVLATVLLDPRVVVEEVKRETSSSYTQVIREVVIRKDALACVGDWSNALRIEDSHRHGDNGSRYDVLVVRAEEWTRE